MADYTKTRSIQVRIETHHKLKLASVITGKKMQDMLDAAVNTYLGKLSPTTRQSMKCVLADK